MNLSKNLNFVYKNLTCRLQKVCPDTLIVMGA